MQINDRDLAPLLIFRKDNIEQKLEEFVTKYKLPQKKRQQLFDTVALKMNSLQEYVPEEGDLSTILIRQEDLMSNVKMD